MNATKQNEAESVKYWMKGTWKLEQFGKLIKIDTKLPFPLFFNSFCNSDLSLLTIIKIIKQLIKHKNIPTLEIIWLYIHIHPFYTFATAAEGHGPNVFHKI